MGFFNALKRLLPHASQGDANEEARQRIRAAWGLDDDESRPKGTSQAESRATLTAISNASGFDRDQWQKKLRRILDELPGSQPQWHDLMTEAHALQLESDWIADRQREEFTFVIRRAVADKVISEADHHKLDLAQADRDVRGRSRSRPAQVLAEAEAFFGAPVKDET